MPEQQTIVFDIPDSSAGTRADAYVTAALSDRLRVQLSRERAKILFESGAVTQFGKILKPSGKLKAGELKIECGIDILESLTAVSDFISRIEPVPIPLDIVYEDEKLVVVNKSAGMSVHPSAGDPNPTVIAALMHRYGIREINLPISHTALYEPALNIAIPPDDAPDPADSHNPDDPVEVMRRALLAHRIGIVHRLDKMTSGCLIFARDAPTQAFLARQFAERSVRKEYVAIVVGAPKNPQGIIDAPITRHPHDRARNIAINRRDLPKKGTIARPARTDFEVVHFVNGLSLLRLRIHTGRTHQIRVHLKYLGLEILGDSLYGTGTNRRFLRFVCSGNAGGSGIHNTPDIPGCWRESYDESTRIALCDALRFDGETCRAGQMLHARLIEFTHPDGRSMTMISPLPDAFRRVCELAGLDML